MSGRNHRGTHITDADFDWALERVVAGMQTRKVINEQEKRVIAYHEAGHALCAELLDSQEKTHRISIIPRGKALGYTLHLPQEDRYLKTKEEMVDWMVVGLGGRVAEPIVFGEITTGAANDLEKVYSVSRSMVTDYGMGTSITSRRVPVDDYSVSEASRRIVDEEQQELTDQAYRRAQKLISREPPAAERSRRAPADCNVRSRSAGRRGDGGRLPRGHAHRPSLQNGIRNDRRVRPAWRGCPAGRRKRRWTFSAPGQGPDRQ